ncbi:putative serine/threonine-protein kinase WNK11 [Histomonas meleagridis]|uniref:putative serine/threonine-protein kinase WNK11 n=1 Tax=Histomonas meleagridis TaxID=135588 RepID=UPI0035597157|nr:putative serine/threonine-protein kinase WNK11 [Histomonas meleagridis]KAH0804103.1 putative serine/threonine-protein kinase WNK11 [Histomonas meleagridis]
MHNNFNKEPRDVIRDPNNRYRRCEVIGSGSYKIVYRAYDQEEGIEVAWNEIRLDRFSEVETNQIYNEIKLLADLSHPRILRLFDAWNDKKRNVLVFITEFFTNGTIRSYVNDVVRTPTRSVIAKWCKQILEGLNYMHTHKPPVIHRDLKCDNLFIDASEGIVKIGDFGLSKAIPTGEAVSCLGTPAYTAPEVYTGKYTTKADIWSFGLCVLEMVTGETPYSECSNMGAIYLKVSSGGLPVALSKVNDSLIADFITLCLLPAEVRPSAAQLLEHSLIIEFDQPAEESTIDDTYDQGKDEPLKVDFPEPLDNPEYMALLARHAAEIEEMKRQQKAARIRMRQKIRSRNRRNLTMF